MSWRNKVVGNTPKVELHSITSLVAGTYKTGKTRLWKELTEMHYKNPKEETLLIAWEPGYETWELEENVLPMFEEGSDEDAWKQWEFFKKDVVPGLVQEAKTDKKVKLLGFDTADRCIDAATAWLLKDRAKKYGVSKLVSLQELTEASKGAENGYTALYDEMKKPIDALKAAKYGIMAMAWTKEKETTLYNGMKYNSVELMMHQTGRKIFESQARLICCLFNEVVVTDKAGSEVSENVKTKAGKEKGHNFHETRTVMVFRPTEYISIAGGSYTDLPEEPVEYSAENFMKVFEDAVKGQLKKTTKSIDELKVEQEQELEDKAKEYATQVSEQIQVTPEELKKSIAEAMQKFDYNQRKDLIGPKFLELLGDLDYRKSEDVSKLSETLKYIEQLKV